MVSNERSCCELYDDFWTREAAGDNGDVLFEYFDGSHHQACRERYGGVAEMRYDVFISVAADGFQPYKNINYEV